MATKYWVGNGGNWSDTAHWSTSSGGGGGAAVPALDEPVVFDSNSITTSGQTVTVNVSTAKTAGIDFSLVSTAFTIELSAELYVFNGSCVLSASVTFSGTRPIYFASGSCDLYCNDVTIPALYINLWTSGGGTSVPTLNLHDAVTLLGTFYISGNLNTNDVAIEAKSFYIIGTSDPAGMSVSLGSSVIDCLQFFRYDLDTSITLDAGESIVSVGRDITVNDYGGSPLLFNTIQFDRSLYPGEETATMYLGAALYCNNFVVLPGYKYLESITYSPLTDAIISTTTSIEVSGSDVQQLVWRCSPYYSGLVRVFLDSGEVSLSYVTLQGICASGSATTGTVDFCTGGTASALSSCSGYYPADAFDDDVNTDWEGDGVPNWIQYDLGSGVTKTAERYSVRSYDGEDYCFKSWTFEGSNDGSNWDILDTQNNSSPHGMFETDNTTAYRYYRWNISEGGYDDPDVVELEILEGSDYTDGATFYALTSNGCIDGGGNAGWLFESAPPEPVFAAPIGQYNEGDHFTYAPGDSGGTAVWREAGTSSAPITDIHRPGCGYWFKETGIVYGGEVGPWVPWNVDQKVEFNEGSKIVKSPTVSGGTPIWEVGKTGSAITDTHVPCGYWFKDYDSDSQLRRICLGLTMGYTKTDMVVDEQQTLYVKDSNGDTVDCQITTWTLSGVGSISESLGPTTVYTAPSYSESGADSAAITLWCGGAVKDTLVISIAHSCDCLDTIQYTSLQMSVNQQQTLTASGGQNDKCYTWTITSGGGSLSAATGKSVIYTAPSSNANCSSNPTITLTCGGSVVDTITIAVNAFSASNVGEICVLSSTSCDIKTYPGNNYPYNIYYYGTAIGHKDGINCDGIESEVIAENRVTELKNATGSCTTAIEAALRQLKNWLHLDCHGGSFDTWTDLRTPTKKAAGCCPYQLL